MIPLKGKLKHQLLIVRKYTKPEQIRGIWVPEAYRVDESRALWEVESVGEEVEDYVVGGLARDWIVVTQPRCGIFCDYAWNAEGIRYERYLLLANEILYHIPWTTGEIDMLGKTKGELLRVHPEPPKKKVGSIDIPESAAAVLAPSAGRIVEVGDDVEDEDYQVGVRVLYSKFVGTPVELNGEQNLLLPSKAVLMVLDEDTEVAT